MHPGHTLMFHNGIALPGGFVIGLCNAECWVSVGAGEHPQNDRL
jgi:hypothetical protein